MSKRLPRLSPDVRALTAIVAVVIVAHAPYVLGVTDPNPIGPVSGMTISLTPGLTPGGSAIDPNVGFTAQALGHRAMLDLVSGHLPWWNPYEGTGAPLAGEMQSAAFFPPNLFLLLGNGQVYEHMLLEIIAGIATYRLLRRLLLSRWASLAGAIAFALNGTFAWFGHAPVNPVPFLPLLLLGIERAYSATTEDRCRGWGLIAVAGALSFYAGFPEVAYIDSVLGVLWFAWRLGCLPRDRRHRLAGKGAVGAVVGALVSAPLIVASLGYLSHGDLGVHSTGLTGVLHLPPQALPQLLMPYVYGPIFGFSDPRQIIDAVWGSVGGYITIALAMLGVIGLLSRGRSGLRLLLTGWIVLVFARMYGQIPLLGHVLGWLPEMSRVEFFRYATPALELSVIVLAALGIDRIAAAAAGRRQLLAVAGGAVAVLLVAAIAAWALVRQAPYADAYFAVAVAWAVLTVVVIVAAGLHPRVVRVRGPVLASLVVLEAVVMFGAPELYAATSFTTDRAAITYLQRHVGSGREFALGLLSPDYGSYWGIGSLDINDIPIPPAFATYIHTRLDPYVDPVVFGGSTGGARPSSDPTPRQELERNLAGYRAAAVNYVLASPQNPLPQRPATFTLVLHTSHTAIYRLAGAAPLFGATGAGCRTADATVNAVTVSCPEDATVIRRETFMTGWSASVAGHSTPITRIDGLFQAIRVPAGSHRVTFSYAPPGIVWAWLALAGGVLALVGTSAPARARLQGVRGSGWRSY